MTRLYLTTCFHGNLGYSSIPETKYKEVIDKCYWPVVSLVNETDIRLGLEFPAKSLEIIQKLDPSLIERVRQLIKEQRIEFVGSGYVQSIFPLIPAKVNLKNLEIGNEIYEKVLGITPKTALVNEHAYSKGLVELYQKTGYESIIIDWVNSAQYNEDLHECKYSATRIRGLKNEEINVIWNNSLFFQKLQRYVYGDFDLDEYIDFVMANKSDDRDRLMMLYGNDMEVFDFRPRDPETLHSGKIKESEIEKIGIAIKKLNSREDIEFILPKDSLKLCYLGKTFDVGTPEAPIVTKKQDKYNILRWAVCGREDYKSNSLCYQAYKLLLELDKNEDTNYQDWKRLVEFWASDYRTHTEDKKWGSFRRNINAFTKDLQKRLKKKRVVNEKPIREIKLGNNVIRTESIVLELSPKKGGAIKNLSFINVNEKPLIVSIPPDYYDNVSYAVDFFSGHNILLDGKRQITDLSETKIIAKDFGSFIQAECEASMGNFGKVTKRYILHKKPRLDVEFVFDFNREIKPTFMRSMIITVNPDAFERESLFYGTTNGGFGEEEYSLEKSFDHTLPIDPRFSARSCLGSTDGELRIGDSKKELIITTNKAESYSVPMLKFENLKDTYFLRLFNTLVETDETTNSSIEGQIRLLFSITARKTN